MTSHCYMLVGGLVHQGLEVLNRMKINDILVSHMKSGKLNSVTTKSPCHSPGSKSPASHCSSLGSIPGQIL